MSLWDVYSISAYAFVSVLHFILCHCLWINRSVPIVPKPRAVPTLLRMPESSTDLQGTLLCTRSVGSAHSPSWRSPHCTYAVSPYSENFVFFKGPEMNKICVRQAWVTQITPRKSQLNFRFITEPAYAIAVTHPILQLYSNPHFCAFSSPPKYCSILSSGSLSCDLIHHPVGLLGKYQTAEPSP